MPDVATMKAQIDELHDLIDCIQVDKTVVGVEEVVVQSTLGEVLKELLLEYQRIREGK